MQNTDITSYATQKVITLFVTATETALSTATDYGQTIVFGQGRVIPARRQQVKKRAPVTMTTPSQVQGYPASVVSSACSENAAIPTNPENITTTVITTIMSTTYVTNPYITQTSYLFIPAETTISVGIDSATTAVTPTTQRTATTSITTTITSVTTTSIGYGPSIILASPTPLIGERNGSPQNYDNENRELVLPFLMEMFGYSLRNCFVSTNGISMMLSNL